MARIELERGWVVIAHPKSEEFESLGSGEGAAPVALECRKLGFSGGFDHRTPPLKRPERGGYRTPDIWCGVCYRMAIYFYMATPRLDAWYSQLRKGSLELVVLALLAEQERYGLEVLKLLAPLGVAPGTLYPLLNRLRRDELLESEWVFGDSGHPRRYYKLTKAGRILTAEMAVRWSAYNREVQALMEPLVASVQ